MSTDLSITSHALLGLLVLDGQSEQDGLTGYELKQRADRTLRFYWVAPAMSQIYSELDRLADRGLVDALDTTEGRRRSRRFRISDAGRAALDSWLASPMDDGFPALKHPVALRLMLGALVGPEAVITMLDGYLEDLVERRHDLEQVRAMLADRHEVRYAARVAEWGLSYYDAETDIVEKIKDDVRRRG